MKRGAFITVEGIDGCGKTTQAKFIKEYLTGQGISVVRTREPGGTKLGEALRELLLEVDTDIFSRTELAMFFAARAQHLHELIWPALARGDWVLCERFTDSTYAYQGGGREVKDKVIATFEKLIILDIEPNLTFLLDVKPEVGRARVLARAPSDRFEKEPLEFSEAVRKAYWQRAKKFQERIHPINANKHLTEVSNQIKIKLQHFLQNWND